jgi:hypothetical protein
MTNNKSYESLAEIKQDLKILKLKRDISKELLYENKEGFENYFAPASLMHKILSPVKKLGIAYLIKKIFK